MMSEFKVAVSKVLTPHASAILLDPEFGLPAAKAARTTRVSCSLMKRAATTTRNPAVFPDLLPHLSVKRIKDMGADAVKILIYYSPFDAQDVNDIKHAFIERSAQNASTTIFRSSWSSSATTRRAETKRASNTPRPSPRLS